LSSENPLFGPWTGPHGGVPPFDRVEVGHFRTALEAAMAERLAEVEAIAADPEPPTFGNTLAAFEDSGRFLDRVMAVFGVFASTRSTPEFQEVERDFAPKLAALADRITQNADLFARIEAVYQTRETGGLDAEQQRLAWYVRTAFVRAGAALDDDAKARLGVVNQRLAELATRFSQNLLADENERPLWLDEEADLAGLSAAQRSAAAAAASARGEPGRWAVLNTRSSVEPFLTHADRRDLRERAWRAFVDRGDNGDQHDNKALIAETLLLRAERARLLGYPTHAHWRVEHAMARTPERAVELLERVWPPAVARVREEVADLQAIADRESARAGSDPIRIEPWDYRYFAEKLRRERFDLDESGVTPYLQLDRLREGMFHVARELFGLEFEAAPGVPVHHPDVRVWKVVRRDGEAAGLWYFDPYARPGKRSGAWMNAYRAQERFAGAVTTLVSNNANFVAPEPGRPVLVSWEDATTLFHEFGHALHGLCSDVAYPTLAGTAVARDYVEFPSQLLEHWLSTPEVLDRFARHHETGEALPRERVERIERAARLNQGFATVEYLASARVDMAIHLAGDVPIDPAAFERECLAGFDMPPEIVMRHRLPHFAHVFSGDGYSAAYYSYLWADTLVADAWEAFTEAGGPWNREVAERLHRHVFSRGNTRDPAEAYRAFRGRDPDVGALMRKRGFAVTPPDAEAP
jgi:peptidyl-dipeptidase Dcp